MTQFTKQEIAQCMEATGMIPVFNHIDIQIVKKVVDASYLGGVRVFEFTNRGGNALSVFTELASYCLQYKDLILGIGTIFNKEDAKAFHNAGAQFIVSPALVPEIASYTNDQQMTYIPGCGSVTEVFNATQLGCTIIKAFPGNVLGPNFIKATKAVLPTIKMMPTGGVAPNRKNLTSWFEAGVICVGMGSQLFKKEDLSATTHTDLVSKIEDTLKLIQTIKTQ